MLNAGCKCLPVKVFTASGPDTSLEWQMLSSYRKKAQNNPHGLRTSQCRNQSINSISQVPKLDGKELLANCKLSTRITSNGNHTKECRNLQQNEVLVTNLKAVGPGTTGATLVDGHSQNKAVHHKQKITPELSASIVIYWMA